MDKERARRIVIAREAIEDLDNQIGKALVHLGDLLDHKRRFSELFKDLVSGGEGEIR